MFPLSVLDPAAVAPGSTARQTLQDTVRTAEAADSLGYHRFWVAEHHADANCAGSAPAVLISHIAARTRRIRVGAGGVMLTNHAPIVVAEQFSVLQALNSGRIDLGIGRASGTRHASLPLDQALRRPAKVHETFPALIDELTGFLRRDWPADHPFRMLELSPPVETLDLYLLGTSENGAREAAQRGLPFVYGHHLGLSKCRPESVALYRRTFEPGPSNRKPYVIASANVLCRQTGDEAEQAAREATARLVRRRYQTANPGTELPAARTAQLVDESLHEMQLIRGTPATVTEQISSLAAAMHADEMMLVPFDLAGPERIQTLRLIAQHRAEPTAPWQGLEPTLLATHA